MENYCLWVIKPHIAQNTIVRGIIKEIFEFKKIKIVNEKMVCPDLDFWRIHYIEHKDKMFYYDLCYEMSNKPVYAMKVYYDGKAYEYCRKLMLPIRDIFGESVRNNAVHVSDSLEAVERELKLWNM